MKWEKSPTEKVVKGVESGWDRKHYVAWQKIQAQVDNINTCIRCLDEILTVLLKRD